MTLHIHFISPLSQEEKGWLSSNCFKVDNDNWLDVTNYIRYFDQSRLYDFYGLICEIIGMDTAFDKWEFR